jgi:hypothetical protein
MVHLARALVGVASDILRLIGSFLRSSSAIRAENLVLRRQLARYIERGIKVGIHELRDEAHIARRWSEGR